MNEAALAQLGIPRPNITSENDLIISAWNFCGGWNPALIDSAAAFYGIADIDLLIEQLLAMRDCVNERQQA